MVNEAADKPMNYNEDNLRECLGLPHKGPFRALVERTAQVFANCDGEHDEEFLDTTTCGHHHAVYIAAVHANDIYQRQKGESSYLLTRLLRNQAQYLASTHGYCSGRRCGGPRVRLPYEYS